VRQRIASHLVDYDDLAAGDFERFLDHRAEQVADVLGRLSSGQLWP
jgi:hypothetical protein